MNAVFPAPTLGTSAAPHASILELIGNTPVVRCDKLSPKGRTVYVKLEAFNPMGSVKDRLALGMIEAAERDGSLKPGQTVVEATSGNTGIGLALVCAAKGYPLVIVMAESFSVERRKILRYLGAKVVLTPAGQKGTGMIAKARELADEHGWFLTRQFENEANADTHEATTGMEIVEAFRDQPLDGFVSGLGTGGTLVGIARALRRHSPATRIVACEPDNSPLMASGIAQPYNPDGSPAAGHPAFRPHLMQGWSPDFIPHVANEAITGNLIDEIIGIDGDEAIAFARCLARQEGIFCGITSGATFAAAYRMAEAMPEGARVLAMLPDTGERYMTTALFDGIGEEMTEDEIAISTSTPGFRFDVPAPPAPAPALTGPVSDRARRRIAELSTSAPIVIFSLKWCEFCGCARNLLDAMGAAYHNIDVDGPDYQDQDWSIDVRRALAELTGAPTVPQIFIGGKHIGGTVDLFNMHDDGALAPMLENAGLEARPSGLATAYTLLPKWMQPR
ncbi:cysteine synthase A [Croceicoccus bisphenolivorans]|uniref:cysteine synthase A n=1 Tax=Croceicoccus bisphenolivorans TaxID=1783232 RepID=UPI0008372A05|nr:cysteine synthase A [Croceicoccus bisphenolivorans]